MRASRRRFIGSGVALGGSLVAGPARGAAPANETLATIAKLRTIHGDFSDKPVSDQDLETILAASVRAANASAFQSYSIVVVRDPAMQRTLCGYRGSCVLVYLADFTRIIATGKRLGHEYDPGNMELFVTASTSTILAVQTAVIAAKSLGVDSLVTNGVHRGDMERLWEKLDLPRKYCFPLIALVLGYPAKEPPYLKGRLSGQGIVHRGTFHNLTGEETDAIIRQYDDKTLHLGLNEDWDQKGYKHYLDWLHKEWLGRNRRPGETQILDRLRKAGFVESANS
jgi:FMN reductase [NAD(P)H]